MLEAKLTSKGQITIPIEIRRLLNIDAGDLISFKINEDGIVMNKSDRPKTIQERFATYEVNRSKLDMTDAMKEIDTGKCTGEEII